MSQNTKVVECFRDGKSTKRIVVHVREDEMHRGKFYGTSLQKSIKKEIEFVGDMTDIIVHVRCTDGSDGSEVEGELEGVAFNYRLPGAVAHAGFSRAELTSSTSQLHDSDRQQGLIGEFDTTGFEESTVGSHSSAYRMLRDHVLQNLCRFPNEPKYRTVRIENRILAEQLFYDGGVVPFLLSCGFKLQQMSSVGGDSIVDALVYTPPVGGGNDTHKFTRAIECICALERRDDESAKNAIEFGKFRRSLGLEVRKEKWKHALELGEIESLVAAEFLRDEAGDELETAEESIGVLERILQNILSNPNEPKFQTLKFSNRTVYKYIMSQKGALEVLVAVCGFELSDESSCLSLSKCLSEEDCMSKVRHGLQVVRKLAASISDEKVRIKQLARDTARQEALREIEATKQEKLRKTEAANRAREQRLAAAAELQGKRVPIAEALAHLMHGGSR